MGPNSPPATAWRGQWVAVGLGGQIPLGLLGIVLLGVLDKEDKMAQEHSIDC